jgi:hypothetical protein
MVLSHVEMNRKKEPREEAAAFTYIPTRLDSFALAVVAANSLIGSFHKFVCFGLHRHDGVHDNNLDV